MLLLSHYLGESWPKSMSYTLEKVCSNRIYTQNLALVITVLVNVPSIGARPSAGPIMTKNLDMFLPNLSSSQWLHLTFSRLRNVLQNYLQDLPRSQALWKLTGPLRKYVVKYLQIRISWHVGGCDFLHLRLLRVAAHHTFLFTNMDQL